MLKENLLSIGDVSFITGININSLRYYDRIGALKPVYINPDTNYRYYSYPQLYILRSIQVCIKLGIPIKKYLDYTNESGDIIFVDEFAEYAKKQIELKIKDLKNDFDMITFMQNKAKEGKKILTINESLIYNIPEKNYFIIPMNIDSSFIKCYNFPYIYDLAKKSGFTPKYEFGILKIYTNNQIKKYSYIELEDNSSANSINVITIPELYYKIKHLTLGSIDRVEKEFVDLFDKNYDKYVMETELVSEKIDVNNVLYELRCSLPE